jgi:hypothetical protein
LCYSQKILGRNRQPGVSDRYRRKRRHIRNVQDRSIEISDCAFCLKRVREEDMTLRMCLAYVAVATSALMVSDVAAHAATKICDVMPWRCRYEPDGRNYYWSPGRHMPEYGSTHSTSAGASAGSPRWGCGATDGVSKGRSWGFPNRAAASYRALSECLKRGAPGSCRVVSCSPSVHNYYEAHATFF